MLILDFSMTKMEVCIRDGGAYCDSGNLAATCENFIDICALYKLLFDLLSINFSVVSERDRAHGILSEILTGGGFSGRFPDGVFVNTDAAPYSDIFSQISRTLDFTSRAEEKLGKEENIDSSSSWEFDDAVNSYYKGLRELNRLLASGDSVWDRKTFERTNQLIWA